MRPAAILAAAALVAGAALAQTPPPLLDETQALLQRGDYAGAEKSALQLLQGNIRAFGPDHPNVATALNLLGAAQLRQGKFGEAEGQFRRMLTIYEKRLGPEHEYTAAALNSLALALEKLGDYPGAETLLRRALAILEKKLGKGHPDTATTLSNLARILDSQGKFAGASKEGRDEAPALLARAEEETRKGNFQAAETLHHQVLAIHEKTLGPEHPGTATSVSNLGHVLHLQGRHAQAETMYRRALAIREKALGPGHPDVATSLNNLATALQELGRDKQVTVSEARARARAGGAIGGATEVESLLRRALSIQDGALGRQHPATANTLNNLGSFLALRGDFAQAEEMHRAALGTMVKVFGEQHPDTAAVLTSLSLALDRQGKIAESEASYRRAIEISRRSGNPRALLVNASRLGYSLAKRGRTREALPYYKEAVETLDFLYSQTRGYSEETRAAFLSQFSAIYRETIRILLLLEKASPGSGYDREALAIASRNQSRIFSEMMRQADVARFSGEPEFVRLRESRDRLQERVAQLRQARATVPVTLAGAAQRVAELDAQVAQAMRELAAAEDALWRGYPRFMELANPRPVTVEDLQHKLLRGDEALLSYVLLPRETVIFAVTREGFRMAVTAARRASLAERVHRMRRAIEKVAAGESVLFLREIDPETLASLYRDLVAPVAPAIAGRRKVFVVADGPLQTVPFELMLTAFSEQEKRTFEETKRASDGSAQRPFLAEYGGLAYLGAQHRFAYLPSLSALASQRLYPKRGAIARLELVAFADPVFASTGASAMGASTLKALAALNVGVPRIPRLPETADEAKDIAGVLGGAHRLYIGGEAQERVAKSGALREAKFVLFATHGFLGGEFLASDLPAEESADAPREAPRAAGQPALALTLVGDLGGEDGLLTMKEVIEDLELNAELVALSACNTAGESAQANNGEGFAGLTRAFMYAGARSLLVSHWSVDSASTRALMTETFRNIRRGMPALEAAGAAQSELRKGRFASGAYHFARAHPFFWAPFVYVGD